MALDLGIGSGGDSCMPIPNEPSLLLNSDGYYWFLYPLIEKLQLETSQYIDLYGDASFSDANLFALERMVADAVGIVQEQPTSWQVHTGTQTSPEHKELYAEVNRVQFLSLLQKWREIIARAKKLGKPVVCFGD